MFNFYFPNSDGLVQAIETFSDNAYNFCAPETIN